MEERFPILLANHLQTKVIMLSQYSKKEKKTLFSKEDLEYQELRKQRKIRKLDFEVR